MSSHHIIRDEQEPALLIGDIAVFPFDLIQQLLEWSPTIAVTEDVLDEVLNWGIKIEIVFCKKASVAMIIEKTESQAPVQIVIAEIDFLEAAIEFFIAKKYPSLNIVAVFEPTAILTGFSKRIELVFYQDTYKIFCCKDDQWVKWVAKDAVFKIFNVHKPVLENLTEEDDRLRALKEGFVTIKSAEKPFWIGEKVE